MPIVSQSDIDSDKEKRKPDALYNSWLDNEQAQLVPLPLTSQRSTTPIGQDISPSNTLPTIQKPQIMQTAPAPLPTTGQPSSVGGAIAKMPLPAENRSPLRIVGDIGRGIGSAIGQVAAPWAMPFIPGTIQHQMFETGRERAGERFSTEQEEAQARIGAEKAKTAFEESETQKNRRGETDAAQQDVIKAYSNALATGNTAEAQRLEPLVKQYESTTEKPKETTAKQEKPDIITTEGGKMWEATPGQPLKPVMEPGQMMPPVGKPGEVGAVPAAPLAGQQATAMPKEQREATPPTKDLLQPDGKTHVMERNPATGAYDVDRGVVREPKVAGEEGTWTFAERDGKPVEMNSKTGEIRDAPSGVAPRGTAAKDKADYEKNIAPTKEARDYADTYLASGAFTGPGDEALMMKAAGLAKASSGMGAAVKPQLDLLEGSRSWFEGAGARAQHALTPNAPWLDPVQRQNIVKAMDSLADSHMKALGGGGAGGGVTVSDPRGVVHTFPDQSSADAFKKAAGIK
jgi:hypothetical protein